MEREKQIRIIKFEGRDRESPEWHIMTSEEYFECFQIPERFKIIIASSRIDGEALDWWESLEIRPTSFEQYKRLLLEEFWGEEQQNRARRAIEASLNRWIILSELGRKSKEAKQTIRDKQVQNQDTENKLDKVGEDENVNIEIEEVVKESDLKLEINKPEINLVKDEIKEIKQTTPDKQVQNQYIENKLDKVDEDENFNIKIKEEIAVAKELDIDVEINEQEIKIANEENKINENKTENLNTSREETEVENLDIKIEIDKQEVEILKEKSRIRQDRTESKAVKEVGEDIDKLEIKINEKEQKVIEIAKEITKIDYNQKAVGEEKIIANEEKLIDTEQIDKIKHEIVQILKEVNSKDIRIEIHIVESKSTLKGILKDTIVRLVKTPEKVKKGSKIKNIRKEKRKRCKMKRKKRIIKRDKRQRGKTKNCERTFEVYRFARQKENIKIKVEIFFVGLSHNNYVYRKWEPPDRV